MTAVLLQLRCRPGAGLFLLCLAISQGGLGQFLGMPEVISLGLLLPSASADIAQESDQKIGHNIGPGLYRVAGIGPELVYGHIKDTLAGFRINTLQQFRELLLG